MERSDDHTDGPTGGCCAPASRQAAAPAIPPMPDRATAAPHPLRASALRVEGGRALVGTATPRLPQDGESPLRRVTLKPYLLSPTTVTNADFAAFIDATGYRTEAERFGWSFVFWAQVPPHVDAPHGVVGVEWWRRVDGADWRNINGPDTAEAWHPDHPVVHVSWNDARAFAHWAGGRLPSEAEWEHAARGGLGDVAYPWGDTDPDDRDFQPCNIWQGDFPARNLGLDGYATTAPARAFAPNGYGFYNMVGNVWEWTAEPFRIRSVKRAVQARMAQMKGYKLSKGGSFLCHASYCWRYRIAARSGNSPDSTTTHHGFRLAFDV
ncbi:formylglycine-generating enzyme family protein [Pacificitalea manganoxidans]|nr:formylglycine-generating enzyme family protein [Pacificitalea manganoxidans]MDR6308546.1 formylglycine-generating enzyme required for sulfatase activity [Pacificitalea manganoxidans]